MISVLYRKREAEAKPGKIFYMKATILCVVSGCRPFKTKNLRQQFLLQIKMVRMKVNCADIKTIFAKAKSIKKFLLILK